MTCADCPTTDTGRANHHWARGLCRRCYDRHNNAGTLDDFARTHRPQADVIQDWLELAHQGYTRANAATRMGMTRGALDRAIARANAQKATAA